MIIDTLDNCEQYFGLGEHIKKALLHLKENDYSSVTSGKYLIDGEHLFACVSSYKTKEVNSSYLEGHEKYLDVQYVCSGTELMGYAPRGDQKIQTPYNVDNDFAFYEGDASFTTFTEGMFAILFPADLHMPGIGDGAGDVHKVVLKVLIDE